MIFFLRAPESDGRPEKWMADSILQQLHRDGASVCEVPCGGYSTIGGPTYFYGHNSYSDMVGQAQQLIQLLAAENEPATVFFMDVWNPAIPLFLSCLRLAGLPKPTMVGYCHGSSGVTGDLYAGYDPARHYEQYLDKVFDRIFMPTDYSLTAWNSALTAISSGAVVTGSPLQIPLNITKSPIRDSNVVFSHRLVEEKGAHLLPYLSDRLADIGLRLKILTPAADVPDFLSGLPVFVCPTKSEYLHHISPAACVVSLADMETFGYSIYEGWLAGALPVVPHTACYPYLWGSSSLYPWSGRNNLSVDAAIDTLSSLLRSPTPVTFTGLAGEVTISSILRGLS